MSFETGGRVAELFGVVRFFLARELAEFELSNNDDRDWPRRVSAERRTLRRSLDGVKRLGRTNCLSSVMMGIGVDEVGRR